MHYRGLPSICPVPQCHSVLVGGESRGWGSPVRAVQTATELKSSGLAQELTDRHDS